MSDVSFTVSDGRGAIFTRGTQVTVLVNGAKVPTNVEDLRVGNLVQVSPKEAGISFNGQVRRFPSSFLLELMPITKISVSP